MLRDTLDELVGRVGRRVGGDDDLELVGRVVELEQVLEPALDHASSSCAATITDTVGSSSP